MASSRIDNPDFIPLALYQLGGAGEFIDVEDIFVHTYAIARERFGWRKYEYPNYKTLYKALRDLEERNPGLLLKTSDGLRRQLSAEGLEWVRERLSTYESLLAKTGSNPPTRRPSHRILNDLGVHPLVRKFEAGERPELVKHQVADVLLCSPDSPVGVFRERLETYRSAASEANRHDLLRFLDFVRDEKPEWFGDVDADRAVQTSSQGS